MRIPRLLILGALIVHFPACGEGGDQGDRPDAYIGTEEDPAWPELQPLVAPFDFGPWLTMPEPGHIVVSWATTADRTGTVRFGTEPDDLDQSAATSSLDNVQHVAIGPLEPGTPYYYEVEVGGVTRGGVFTTPGRDSWRFIHQAEFHSPTMNVFVALWADAIRAFRPHVVVESGDMVDNGDNPDHWRGYFRTAAPWISNVILLPAGSNHVKGADGNAFLKALFVLPGNERWYPTRYGAVQFLTLDSTFDSSADIEADEPAWIADEVAAAHDGDDDPEFLIAAWHYPACSSSYASRNQLRSWIMTHFIDTMRASGGIDLALVGHDKYYERSIITGGPGIVHVQSNIGKRSPSDPGNNHPDCIPVVTNTSTLSVPFFTVEPGRLSARVLDAEGAEIDSFVIEK